MTQVTNLKMHRKYEGRNRDGSLIPRKKPLEFPQTDYELDCGVQKFNIKVSPGQLINKIKMCKKLLKANFNKNNEQEKNRFVSKGFKGQNPY